jgi:hypothetical protein
MSKPARRPDKATEPERVYTDLDALIGSWVEVSGFEDAIREQDQVDERLWR